MSFGGGDQSFGNPIFSTFSKMIDTASGVLDTPFSAKFGRGQDAAPKAPASMLTSTVPSTAPVAADTPGRHKTLLGA